MKWNVHMFVILALLAVFAISCTTTKNTGEAIKEGSTEAAQEVGDKAEDVGEEIGDKAEDAGEKIEDASITAAIKMKMANDELVKASKIDVDTSNGYVTLNGTVTSQAEADRAIQLARAVDGVKGVQSNLVIQ